MNRKLFVFFALGALGIAGMFAPARFNNAGAGPTTRAASLQKGASARDRCGTRHIDETTATQYEEALKSFNSNRSPGQIRRSGSVSIPVYYHVVNKGKGIENGDVPTKWLRDQTAVLNAAFAGADPTAASTAANTPFRFETAGIDRTTNPDWFNAAIGSEEEREMKAALHVGGAGTLNFYVTNAGGVRSEEHTSELQSQSNLVC